MHFKFCGQKLKKSAEFAKFVDENVPPQFQNRFQKSEKGVDTEICCDALRLSTTGRLERLFLLSNDSDMIPLCRTLKEFGSNVSILHLSQATQPNADLLREADSYNVVTADDLPNMFLPLPQVPPEGVPIDGEAAAEAPDGETSEKEPEKPQAGQSNLSGDAFSNAEPDEGDDGEEDQSPPKSG